MNKNIKFDPRIFKMNYSPETRVIYEILVFHDGEISPQKLVEMVSHVTNDDLDEVCRCALWALYKDGFVELSTLTHRVIDAVNRNEV